MRLAGIQQLGYYPTSKEVAELITTYIAPSKTVGRIYDPCMGQGEFLQILGKQLNLETFGVELSEKRYEIAKEIIANSVCAPAQNVTVTDRSMSLLALNPPYDENHTENMRRVETDFLRITTSKLMQDGILVYIVPDYILEQPEIYKHLLGYYEDIRIYRYIESKYRQIVLFGKKRAAYKRPENEDIAPWFDIAVRKEYPDLSEQTEPFYVLPVSASVTKFNFYSNDYDPVSLCNASVDGTFANTFGWRNIIDPTLRQKDLENPAMPLKKGHLAMILASGMMGTISIKNKEGRPMVVKGKVVKTYRETADEETNTTKVRDVFIATVSVIQEKEISIIRDTEELAKFLGENGEEIAKYIAAKYRPLYNFDPTEEENRILDGLSLKRKLLPGQEKPGFLPSQRHIIAAMARAAKKHGNVTIQGEMGIGKSGIGAAMLEMLPSAYPALVICPPHLVEKWIREIHEVIPNSYAVEIRKIEGQKENGELGVNDVKDLLDLYESGLKGKKIIGVISNSMASMGPGWEHAYIVKKDRRGREYLACPVCGNPVTIPDPDSEEKEWKIARNEDELGNSQHFCRAMVTGKVLDEDGKKIKDNGSFKNGQRICGSPLFGYKAKRESIASYILKHAQHKFKVLIADEVHQFKSKDTDRGIAFGQLVKAVKHTISLTGTYFGGRASSIFFLMHRTSNLIRKDFGFHDENQFVSLYGVVETTLKEKSAETTSNGSTGNKRYTKTTKELPGVSPAIIGYLLHNTVFLSLADLGIALPEYKEITAPIDADENEELHRQMEWIKNNLKEMALEDKRLLSTWLQWGLARGNSAFRNETIVRNNFDQEPDIIKELPAVVGDVSLEDRNLLPKEVWLRDFVKTQKQLGNKILVYLRQTGTRDIRGRIDEILKSAKLNVTVLGSNIAARKREAWINTRTPYTDVLVTNPKLVETGLDLVSYNVVIFYEIEYSLYTLWQAVRRVWRLGQKKPVLAVFAYYKDSMEDVAIRLVGVKMKAGQVLYGDSVSGAIVEETDEDILMAMARDSLKNAKDLPDLQSMFSSRNIESHSPVGVPTVKSASIVHAPEIEVIELELQDVSDIWARLKAQSSAPINRKKKTESTGQESLF